MQAEQTPLFKLLPYSTLVPPINCLFNDLRKRLRCPKSGKVIWSASCWQLLPSSVTRWFSLHAFSMVWPKRKAAQHARTWTWTVAHKLLVKHGTRWMTAAAQDHNTCWQRLGKRGGHCGRRSSHQRPCLRNDAIRCINPWDGRCDPSAVQLRLYSLLI